MQGANQGNSVEQGSVKVVDKIGLDPGPGSVVGRVQGLEASGWVAQEQLVGTPKKPMLNKANGVEFCGEKGAKTGVPGSTAPKARLPEVPCVQA